MGSTPLSHLHCVIVPLAVLIERVAGGVTPELAYGLAGAFGGLVLINVIILLVVYLNRRMQQAEDDDEDPVKIREPPDDYMYPLPTYVFCTVPGTTSVVFISLACIIIQSVYY